MKQVKLFDDNHTQWFVFGRDPQKPGAVIDTNQYLVICGDQAIMLDPGGSEIFPTVLTAVSSVIDLVKIKAYLCSHQDPDIMSSLPLWMGLTPNADIYLSWLWESFVAHFGQEYTKNFKALDDEGAELKIGDRSFQFVPAHHCHSSGNFHFYDPVSKILFTGDVGAALLPSDSPLVVGDFKEHTQYMETFHKRWMPSNDAKNLWVQRVRKLAPAMLCPQHGAIFQGENVEKFLDWFEDLEVGKLKKYA